MRSLFHGYVAEVTAAIGAEQTGALMKSWRTHLTWQYCVIHYIIMIISFSETITRVHLRRTMEKL